MNLLGQEIGKLARDIPGATAVFHKFGLDFCCGGSKSLEVMIDKKGIEHDPILSELQKLVERGELSSGLEKEPNDVLVTHILNRYHEVHREQFPELIRLASRVEHVHTDHPECPKGLSDQLKKMYEELEAHMKNEEENLFPLIMSNMPISRKLIDDLQAEHTDHGEMLEEVERMTRNISLPEKACNTWQALYKGLEVFKIDLMQHIHLENNVLFDRLRK